MRFLRYFVDKAKYIKKLEEIIEYYEAKEKTREAWIIVQRDSIKEKDRQIIELSKKISELKKTPPEPKRATNIDISDPIFQKMIKAGRSALVKKAHPDHGGSREEFEKVEKAYEMLKGLKIQPQEKSYSGLGGFGGGLYGAQQQAMAAQQQAMAAAQRQQQNGRWPYGY